MKRISVLSPPQLVVKQRRFLSDPSAESANDSPFGYRWDVPLTHLSDASRRTQTWLHYDMDKGEV